MATLTRLRPALAPRMLATRRCLATASTSFDPAVYPANLVPPYEKMIQNLEIVKKKLGRPLTLAEKIVYSHLTDPNGPAPVRGESYLKLSPDRVAMQDASAQMALLQFMLTGMPTTAVPSSIHCDHLIEAHEGGDKDVATSVKTEKEIYDFLQACGEKFGIGFWKPGSGIIHQIVLENYAAPGLLMLGTDSHTPNAGGLGTCAIGVGGADAVDAMANIPWELKAPKILGVHLTGQLSGWTSPKDVILKLAGLLTVSGGTGHIIEYFGPGAQTLSATGMATICNMGAEVGATTSLFPYSPNMAKYLIATRRPHVAAAADAALARGILKRDDGSDKQYDKIVEINLSELEPMLNGPFTPDAAIPISKVKDLIKEKGWKDEVKACLIGSCTNSSYQDMSRAASIAEQALAHNTPLAASFLITPGSEQIRATIARDGQSEILTKAGGTVLANACGPCIGQWKRTDLTKDEENSILTSFNRNFRARNDGFAGTMNFLAAPEIVTAVAFSGKLSFNPVTDSLVDPVTGKPWKFEPPKGDDLPSAGFEKGRETYSPPPAYPTPDAARKIAVDPKSTRLQLLDPFSPWDGKELTDLRVLVKAKGKCTTDHISAAGKWLKYKGHLQNISENTLIGAQNAFNGKVNMVKNLTNGKEDTIPNVAKDYKSKGVGWIVVADHNYGEGSAREHAAMQPRYLGARLIVSRSFARIHETNLKKQGVIPITFADPASYDLIPEDAVIQTVGLSALAPGSKVVLVVTGGDGKTVKIDCVHTLSEDQIGWIRAGSALNRVKELQNK